MNDRLKVFVIHGRGATPRFPYAAEEGGDLDTVSSNVFYGAWASSTGAPHEFAHVQYHDGLMKTLGEYENADLYIPDLPIDTVPDLEGDVRRLARRGCRLVHYLDHHPWSDAHIDMLKRLQSEGLLDRYAMSGARKGEHLPKEAQACGAELVYDAVIRDASCETAGLKELKRITRLEDLGLEDNPLAVRLSKLISSGYSKHSMVTALQSLREPEDIARLMQGMGWDIIIAEWSAKMDAVLPRLKNNLCEIRISPGDGSGDSWNIICCLAPRTYPGEVLPNVSTAIKYLREFVPMDYFFYCYGSRALTTRKTTLRPGILNLGHVIERICTYRDGGHPEAASGRPQGNAGFPHERLGYITGRNFIWYARYLGQRIRSASGVRIESVNPLRISSFQKTV